MDVRQLLKDIDSRIARNPGSTAKSLAEELNVTVPTIEKAVREVDGISLNEYLENRQMAHALKIFEDQREAEVYACPRNEPRRVIPGASVSYVLHGNGRFHTSIFYPIFDISRGGMAFLCDSPLKPGRKISLFLKCVGEKEELRLEGEVVYALAGEIGGYPYRLGVRFSAFDAKQGGNSAATRETLTRLLKNAVSRYSKNQD